jgi:hypothetical protein
MRLAWSRVQTPWGDRPTLTCRTTLRARSITLSFLGPARGDVQRLAVGRHVHAVGAAGHGKVSLTFSVARSMRLMVLATRLLTNTLLPSPAERKACAPLPVLILPTAWARAGHVEHLHAVAAGQADQQRLVVVDAVDVGRHGPVATRQRMVCVGRSMAMSLVAVLHGHVGNGAGAVDPDVAGRLAGGDALGQLQVLAVPAVDVDVVQAVAAVTNHFMSRRELQLVRIDDAVDDALDFGRRGSRNVSESPSRIGHDDRLLVGRHVDVVRLLAGGNAQLLGPARPGRSR